MNHCSAYRIARAGVGLLALVSALVLSGCGSVRPRPGAGAPRPPTSAPAAAPLPAPAADAPWPAGTISRGKSRWVPVPWSDLPGFDQDNWFDGWSAWANSCERSSPVWANACPQVRQLSIASTEEQRAWLQQSFQAYRVESPQGDPNGMLTGYFEPQLDASRVAGGAFTVPVYQPPAGLAQRKPWYTRQEIDTLDVAQAALRDRVIAYVADPVDAMVLQIQGSGRLRIVQPDGSAHMVRLRFAGTNDQPYRSVGRWLLDQGLIKDATWPGIKAWLAQNPQRTQELLWANPRVVFFREEPLSDLNAGTGPIGAQGVPLTPQRSIAVDPASIPYGTPVWLVSGGAQTNLRRLVLAQDTGSAITGAVRADYFAGWGSDAAELAGRLRQGLQMWVIWPK